MERIIISEIDNTSNIEGLSSYDVVYVPGFATNDASPLFEDGTTLYRNPTLCTTTYEFKNLFGDTCPTFPKAQPYPIATSNKWGFPYFAIPNYVPEETPILVPRLNNFTGIGSNREDIINAVIDPTATANYYTYADSTVEGWAPTSGVTYYQGSYGNGIVTMSYFDTDEITSGYANYVLFTCGESPVNNMWYEKINDEFILTSDSEVSFDANKVVKAYYTTNAASLSLMFRGPSETSLGDADPGYRYALYLLSLGIPVYYEQMNSIFVEVDMNDTTMYKTDAQGRVSPILNEWSVLNGTVYVKTTDATIVEGVTYYVGSDISIDSMYSGLIARFTTNSSDASGSPDYSFDSIGDYAVKYLTSGGYPVFEYGPLVTSALTQKVVGSSPLAIDMIKLAWKREDAVALIDHTNNPNRTIYETDAYSVVFRARDEFQNLGDTDSFGAMFTPWYTCTNAIVSGGTNNSYDAQMPGSLAFLTALAQQVRTYNPWLAVSGVARGQVPYCGGLHSNFQLTNNVADSYQILPDDMTGRQGGAISINPITYIRNYGYCIWGNRTLRNNVYGRGGTKVTSFLNIRNTVSDIKKKLYEASRDLLFEQNTSTLWINFKSVVTPLLDTMVADYILESYTITKYNIDPDTGVPVPAYKVLAVIKIVPINSVEVFELRIQMENSELTVSETE